MDESPSPSRRTPHTSNPHRPIIIASAVVMALSVFLTWLPDAEAKKRRERAPKQIRDGLYLRFAFGVPGSCIEGTDFCVEPDTTLEAVGLALVAGPDIALGGRFGVIGIEGRGMSNPFQIDGKLASAEAFVGTLKLFPMSRGEIDPYLAAGVGFMSLARDVLVGDNPRGKGEIVRAGFATHLGGGLDFFLDRQVALGLGFDRFFLFPVDARGQELDEEGFWTGRLNLTIYFGASTSKKKKRK